MFLFDFSSLSSMKKYLRLVDYIGVAQLYLKDNFLLERPLVVEDFKPRILGHWGTVPGLNFIYAHCNRVIQKNNLKMLFVVGPGHGAPAVLANLFLEGSLQAFYPQYPVSAEGMGRLIKDFSWPHTPFPSHVTPSVPGSILEGGELGYSLGTAYGAVFDNPDLIATVVVGDGEAETGAIATAWHSNKFLSPKTSGAVLPIVHINGYKISNPTIFGRMDDDELRNLFLGYGYEPLIVSGKNIMRGMTKAMDKAVLRIRQIQNRARSMSGTYLKPRWPVILLRSPKGWNGLDSYHGHAVAGSFHSHGVPVPHPSEDEKALATVEAWLKSYKIHSLLDKTGSPKPVILKSVPSPDLRMGSNPHTVGGNLLKNLKLPSLDKAAVAVSERGVVKASSMEGAGKYFREIFRKNPSNFRMFCPDEIVSNKLEAVFDVTRRAFQWPIFPNDEFMDGEGRVMEMLSEHSLQAWYSGYLLTGRHGVFVSYEAFMTIISSMVDQYAKFLKQSSRVPWRKPIASAIYINSSVGWRQDHNGYSHQNPSFVSGVLQKHGEFCQIYYPPDANSMLVALEETLLRRDSICVIVAGKRKMPQWLSMDEAREQAKRGIGVWEWVTGPAASKNPDVVLASAGDYMTEEALKAVELCKELIPSMKIRFVNVSELTALCLGDACSHAKDKNCLSRKGVERFFTKDKPVIFNYHGYVNDLEQILWPYVDSDRFTLHGYSEEGSTTTPFDIKVLNRVSRYHLAMDMIDKAALRNKKVESLKKSVFKEIKARLEAHHVYIREHGDDPKGL